MFVAVCLQAAVALLLGCDPNGETTDAINRANKSDPLPIELAAAGAVQTTSAAVAADAAEPTSDANAATLLARFHNDLLSLVAGERTQPVTILHLGDDHVAADRLTASLRKLLQARFGDAGRGLVMPAGVYRSHRADGVRFGLEGDWRSELATETATGGFGLTGARVVTKAKGDGMTVEAESGFDSAEVLFAGGPERGRAEVLFDGQRSNVQTRRADVQSVSAATQRPGKRIEIRALQNRSIAVAGIVFGHRRPGVRYVNIGFPEADVRALAGLDQAIAGEELRRLAPSLIVLGFGTRAGFDDDLDKTQYAADALSLVKRIRSWAPEASLVIVGPPDAVRLPDYAGSAARQSGDTACRALGADETGGYRDGIAAADPRLARWHPPINLADVRAIWRRIAAREGALYWDWHGFMGGDCSIHAWAYAEPPLAQRDHILLTEEGYRRSAEALFQQLLNGLMTQPAVAAEPSASQ
jgi:hypothetical protein